MKRNLSYLLLAAMISLLALSEVSAQTPKLDRWVMGSGGTVGAVSGDITMYGTLGQVAIERIENTYQGEMLDVYQGFWGPIPQTPGSVPGELEKQYRYRNYPNPFSASTTIEYSLPVSAMVTLTIYDVNGGKVKVLVNQIQFGTQNIMWDGTDYTGQKVASGSYTYELSVTAAQSASSFEPFTLRQTMILAR